MGQSDERIKIYLANLLADGSCGSQRIKVEYQRVKEGSRFRTSESDSCPDCLGFWEEDYPKQLAEISDSPALLFYRGDHRLLKRKLVSIVGTRKISQYGRRICSEILAPLFSSIKNTHAIVSGLAYGVDSEVHRTALEVGIPTIGVVAGGIDQGFPNASRSIYERLIKEGLLLAEFPAGRQVVKGMFPMRNRIMAGLASYTIVVESGATGGSLITARHAAEYGREVLVFPGSIFSPSSAGCNRLIADGATPVNSVEDLFLALRLDVGDRIASGGVSVFGNMDEASFPGGFTVLELQKVLKKSIGELSALLTKSEINGILGRYDNGKYYLKAKKL